MPETIIRVLQGSDCTEPEPEKICLKSTKKKKKIFNPKPDPNAIHFNPNPK